ncbi:MAG: taurine dioxygenase [Verrucomicrobiaceae bacterium]|nr:taurine dioxygenase [Verrucomicrobiaceae bacterium]
MNAITADFINHRDASSALTIVPVAGRIGAEIRDISLARDLNPATQSAIRAALIRHKVIFFRGQTDLGDVGHEAVAEGLGAPVKHPTVPIVAGSRFLLELSAREGYGASSWHTDVTFVPDYPQASILRALVVPEAGGDTMWANTVTAYADLPVSLKQLADSLRAVHCNAYDYEPSVPYPGGDDSARFRDIFVSKIYQAEHPVVRVHPESGEKSLLLGHFLKHFVGLGLADSRRLYALFQEYITRPENTVRWRWQVGDVAIWDNRATQHRAVADFGTQKRTLRRATVAGDIAVGINGEKSKALESTNP